MARTVGKRRVTRRKAVKTTALSVQNRNSDSLSLTNQTQILEFGKELRRYIKSNSLSVEIDGKDYPLCGAWKYCGMNFGLTAVPVSLEPQHQPGQYISMLYIKKEFKGSRKDGSKYEYFKDVPIFIGFAHDTSVIDGVRSRNTISKEITKPYYSYKCEVEVRRISDDKIMNKGTSVCTNMESLKAGFDEYAVMGQAQTRTISRALKNLLDYVLQAAGMEGTPGEEMTKDINAEYIPDHEPPTPEQKQDEFKTKVKKQKPSPIAFQKLLDRAAKGEKVSEMAKNSLELTQDQIDAIELIEKKF